jgi:hypothetical protein
VFVNARDNGARLKAFREGYRNRVLQELSVSASEIDKGLCVDVAYTLLLVRT